MPQTLYIVTYPAGTGTPSNAQIVAGQQFSGAAASWADHAEWTGSGQYLEATGLSASTEYDSAAVIYDGTTYSNVVQVVDTWTTLSGTAYTLTANNGTLTLTGQSATLTKGNVLTAQACTLTLTGQSATIKRDKVLTASNGTINLTGQSATITHTTVGAYDLIAQHGTLTLTGQSAAIKRSKVITANNGTLSLTGQSANITHTPAGSYDLIAQGGTLTLTGQDATITRSRSIVAQHGTITLTGQSAGVTWALPSVQTLTQADLDAIATAVWSHSSATSIAVQLAEAWGRLGLDPSKPLISGQTEISFGAIVMVLSGNETSSTLTRQ